MTSVHDLKSGDLEHVRTVLGDDYEIAREIGRGGMAIVYHGRERQLGRDVAIKVLLVKETTDASFVERFQREARIAAQLEHPHIVPIHRVGQRGDVIFFVMKLLRGPSFADRLLIDGPLGASAVRQMIIETADALGYAHRHGVIHRDIKPDNLMLDNGRCVVTDFGIARSLSSVKLTSTGTTVGTPLYMSPEQGSGSTVDARSDIYSLGVVAYECLTGSPPFTGDNPVTVMMHHLQTPLPRPRLANEEESALFAVIARMLAKAPGDRFQSTDDLLAAISASVMQAHTAPPGQGSLTGTNGSSTATTLVALVSANPGRSAVSRVDRMMLASRLFAQRMASRLREVKAYAARKGRRFWLSCAIGVMSLLIAYKGIRLASLYHSRCPAGPAMARQTADNTASTSYSFSVLVDNIGSVSQGSNLDVYYDVCGMQRGAPLTTRISVVKNESGLRRIFGGVTPVLVSFDETASGPATRRHRAIDLAEMPPGSYTLALTVSDDRGRQREHSMYFQITGR